MRNQGHMAVGWGILWAVAAGTAGVLGSYYSTNAAQDNKSAVIKSELKSDISQDRERISSLETGIKDFKDLQEESRADIKELLRRTK